jgi:hypothetical protein
MDLVCLDLFFHNILICLLRSVNHSDASHLKVVGHCKLGISVETYILALLAINSFVINFKSLETSGSSIDLTGRSNVITSIHFVSLANNHLLEQDLMYFNVTVVHDQVLS